MLSLQSRRIVTVLTFGHVLELLDNYPNLRYKNDKHLCAGQLCLAFMICKEYLLDLSISLSRVN